MPHKHTRRRSTSPTAYDLPPTSLARPLPTFTPKTTKLKPNSKLRASKPASGRPAKTPYDKKAYPENDTPRAFTRLMTYRPPPRSGLDDGQPPPHKKRKRDPPAPAPPLPGHASSHTEPQQAAKPQILPGEPLSSFAARVDAALPVRGLTAKGKRMGGEGRQTKTERRMQRMQREWRVEEERRRGKREELLEEEEEEGGDVGGGSKGGRKGGKKGGRQNEEEEEGDPWAGIAAKPLRQEGGGLVGLHDVVLAPPKFRKVPREVYATGGGGKGVGVGLKRQAELGEARRRVVEGYRALMRERGREGGVPLSPTILPTLKDPLRLAPSRKQNAAKRRQTIEPAPTEGQDQFVFCNDTPTGPSDEPITSIEALVEGVTKNPHGWFAAMMESTEAKRRSKADIEHYLKDDAKRVKEANHIWNDFNDFKNRMKPTVCEA